MVAKNTAETDDQIIDLTELIEKGEVPANDPSEQPQAVAAPEAEADQKALNAHLRGLNDGSSAADAEIDDLLAQMDIKDEGQSDPNDVALDFSAPSTQTDHPIDPNEQLLMPGMGDVDNLLNALDIPPQPAEREPEVAASASANQAASQATNQAADDAVDALLNDFHAAAPAPQAPAEPQNNIPDLDELLASVNTAPATGNSSDIDDLLNAANLAPAQPEPAAAPSAASAAQSPAFSNDDLDSLLAAAADDLQSKLDAAQPEAAPTPAPAPAAEPQPDLNADLDSLLAAVTGGAAPAAEPQEDISDVLLHPELELMADAQPEPVAEALPDSLPELEPVLEPVQELQPEQAVELPTDFDALLAAATEQAATSHVDMAPTAVAPEDTAPAGIQDIMADASAQAESDVFEAVAAAEPAQADDLPLLEPDEILPPDASVQAEPSVNETAEMEAAEVEPAAADMPESAGQFAYEPAFRPQAAPVADSTDTAADGAAVAVSGAALEAVMEQAKEASSHAIDAFAQAFDASTRAADAAETASKLTARVEQCEAALQEAGDRIIALETALEAQIHASHELASNSLPRQELEDMFVEGHPLYQSLMDCISKAVAAALASAPAQQTEHDDAQSLVEEHLQPVVTAARSATARIDALETRLDALEPRFNDRVERAAAAAAARILREEIGRLLEGQ